MSFSQRLFISAECFFLLNLIYVGVPVINPLLNNYVNVLSNCYSVSNIPSSTEWTPPTNVYSPSVSNAMIAKSWEGLKSPLKDSIKIEIPSQITSNEKSPISETDMKTEFVNFRKKTIWNRSCWKYSSWSSTRIQNKKKFWKEKNMKMNGIV